MLFLQDKEDADEAERWDYNKHEETDSNLSPSVLKIIFGTQFRGVLPLIEPSIVKLTLSQGHRLCSRQVRAVCRYAPANSNQVSRQSDGPPLPITCFPLGSPETTEHNQAVSDSTHCPYWNMWMLTHFFKKTLLP